MHYFMQQVYQWSCVVTQMQIGLVVSWTEDLLAALCFLLGVLLLLGAARSSPQLPLSSTEAEYRGVAIPTCEVAWLRKLLMDMGMHVDRGVVIYCDNLSRIHLARSLVFHAQTKHIEVHYHFV